MTGCTPKFTNPINFIPKMTFAKVSEENENIPKIHLKKLFKSKMDLLKTERVKIMYKVPENYNNDIENVKMEEKVRLVTEENSELKKRLKNIKIDSEILIKANEELKSKFKEQEEELGLARNNCIAM
jgi:hypothetical protein